MSRISLSEEEIKLFATRPILAIPNWNDYFERTEVRAEWEATLPFDLSYHHSAKASVSQEFLKRTNADLKIFADSQKLQDPKWFKLLTETHILAYLEDSTDWRIGEAVQNLQQLLLEELGAGVRALYGESRAI